MNSLHEKELKSHVPPDPALVEEIRIVDQQLENESTQEILKWAIERFAPHFTFATAFGPEGMVLIHMLSQIDKSVPIFNLDTGYQFPETLALREVVQSKYGISVALKSPDLDVADYERLNGGPVYLADPGRCCADRKLAVLHQAANGMQAWASAIRRDQSPERSTIPIVGWDKKFGLVKISPLAKWSKKEIWNFIVKNDVPYNPLHDQGYTSIGCWPCTRAILAGEDERAGRWSGFSKTECGLHTKD